MSQKTRSPGYRINLWMLKFARNWLKFVLVILAVYITMPWVAPTFKKLGFDSAANAIYTFYSPFCHQFAFRSIFLYGDQPFYPRGAAETPYKPFESYAVQSESFIHEYQYWYTYYRQGDNPAPPTIDVLQEFSVAQQIAARHFLGDNTMGYKTTLCARDIAIYTMIFIGGLIYWKFRWRIRPLPFLLYIFVGLGPIGLDGFSQLLSYPPFNFWDVRETEPIFRLMTGGLFGLMSAWLGFPYIERSMQDTIDQIELKFKQAGYDISPATPIDKSN